MKPEYEKPAAVPLGEALKGSGECTVGSAVLPIAGTSNYCTPGATGPFNSCQSGATGPNSNCQAGTDPAVFLQCQNGALGMP